MARLKPTRLQTDAPAFAAQLETLLAVDTDSRRQVDDAVRDILEAVRQRGDAAVCEFTARFDRRDAPDMAALEISAEQCQQALERIDPALREALEYAAARIRRFHERQRQESWEFTDDEGVGLGQRVMPLQRAGLYVPGGKAAYPSTVLMTAIPAKVAGVDELIMVSPAPGGELNDAVLAAAAIAGVDRCFSIGGAQAVAALAYGTETIPAVDKIVGPGNVYVAAAKRQVAGRVAVDMEAGPSEILVISDADTPPDWLALDLFSQAEHDENAQSILLSDSAELLDQVLAAMERLLPTMDRADTIAASLNGRGALILCRDLDEAVTVSNRVAPEHLELAVSDPDALLPKVRHAGAIFLGRHTPEALGDYVAGPSHVLPTSGTARFSSPLGVYDFQTRSSLIRGPAGAQRLQSRAGLLARSEGLLAHARSAEVRLDAKDD